MKITHLFRQAALHYGLSVSGLLTVLTLCPLTAASQQPQPQQRARIVVRTRQTTSTQSPVRVNNTVNQRTQQPAKAVVITGDFDFSRFEQKYYTDIPAPPDKENMSSEDYLRYLQQQAALLEKRSNPAQGVQTRPAGNVPRSSDSPVNSNYVTPTNRQVNESYKSGFSSPRPEILSIERKVFELVNARRRQYGIQSVMWSDALELAARQHSENMGINHFFNHIGLDGSNVRDRVNRFNLEWSGLGENLAFNYGGKNPVEQAVEQWMNSPAHRENMLKGTWTQSAVGVYVTSEGQYYFTQIFLKS